MRRLRAAVCWATAMTVLGAATATADGAGGPMPPQQGGQGAHAPGVAVTYVTVPGRRDRTLLERVERGTGAVLGYRALRGSWGVPGIGIDGSTTGLSADGRTLVLARMVMRYPPRRTELAVVDPSRLAIRRRVTLPGWHTVDAVSPDGRWIYTIRYKDDTGTAYDVRAYDLVRNRFLPRPITDPREPDENMQGMALTRTTSEDGRWMYTLYQRPEGEPFIHALDTAGRTARCIDLPAQYEGTDLSDVRLGIDPDATVLRVEDTGTPMLVVDTRRWTVRRPAVRAAAPAPRPAAPDDDGGSAWWWVAAALPAAGLIALVLRRRMRPPVSRAA